MPLITTGKPGVPQDEAQQGHWLLDTGGWRDQTSSVYQNLCDLRVS